MVKQEAGINASFTQQQLQNPGSDEATSTEEQVLNSEQPHQQPLERKRPGDSNTSKKNYSCEESGKSFSQSLQFRRPKRVHTGEKHHSPRNRIKTNQKGEHCL